MLEFSSGLPRIFKGSPLPLIPTRYCMGGKPDMDEILPLGQGVELGERRFPGGHVNTVQTSI